MTNSSPAAKIARRSVVENISTTIGPLARRHRRPRRGSACSYSATPANRIDAAASQFQPERAGRNAPPK